MKGAVIGAICAIGFALIFLLGFLGIWLRSKKERAAKKYTEVKRQVHQEPSKFDIIFKSCIVFLILEFPGQFVLRMVFI